MIRFGVIGLGNIGGQGHSKYLYNGDVENGVLSAVCDIDKTKLDTYREKYGDKIAYYENYEDMVNSDTVDAIIVGTPHYLHPEMALAAIKAKKHVISEKPLGVYAKGIDLVSRAAKEAGVHYVSGFCMRTDPFFKKIKDMIAGGELGTIKRVNWIATGWYRSQAYHDSSPWRSSWSGEGGGVLINQSPHNLDIITWLFGLPKKVTAFAEYGKYYDIEVEDEVTAYLNYDNFSVVYIASTGEAPGTNRLEIVGDMGKLVYENGKIIFSRNKISEREFNKTNTIPFGKPEMSEIEIEPYSGAMKLSNLTQNLVSAILHGEELISSGESGEDELRLSNAIHLSSWLHETVDVPVDEDIFLSELNKRR